MIYRLATDSLVILHLIFICFVIVGGLLVIKWRWITFLHLPAAIWGILIELKGWICPLTSGNCNFGMQLDRLDIPDGFIDHYILPILYPSDLSNDI